MSTTKTGGYLVQHEDGSLADDGFDGVFVYTDRNEAIIKANTRPGSKLKLAVIVSSDRAPGRHRRKAPAA